MCSHLFKPCCTRCQEVWLWGDPDIHELMEGGKERPWPAASSWGLLCLLSHPLGHPLLRKWAPWLPPSSFHLSRHGLRFCTPNMCASLPSRDLLWLFSQAACSSPSKATTCKGSMKGSRYHFLFSVACFSAVTFWESDQGEIIQMWQGGGG